MTYCLAIKLNAGLIFASDSRTNAGVDYVNAYSKMHTFSVKPGRFFLLLSAGNLATTQAVVNLLRRDLITPGTERSLNTVEHLFDAARYVGDASQRAQHEHSDALKKSGVNPEASFILGGQIGDEPHDIFLIYPQGNYISASPANPYLQIGETKYGKPILDRIIRLDTSVENAARCALVSLDSTMRSNISVGPPLELAVYLAGQHALTHHQVLDSDSPFFARLQQAWNDGLKRAFAELPRFDWEQSGS
jgi:putative proteasome-type protease